MDSKSRNAPITAGEKLTIAKLRQPYSGAIQANSSCFFLEQAKNDGSAGNRRALLTEPAEVKLTVSLRSTTARVAQTRKAGGVKICH